MLLEVAEHEARGGLGSREHHLVERIVLRRARADGLERGSHPGGRKVLHPSVVDVHPGAGAGLGLVQIADSPQSRVHDGSGNTVIDTAWAMSADERPMCAT